MHLGNKPGFYKSRIYNTYLKNKRPSRVTLTADSLRFLFRVFNKEQKLLLGVSETSCHSPKTWIWKTVEDPGLISVELQLLSICTSGITFLDELLSQNCVWVKLMLNVRISIHRSGKQKRPKNLFFWDSLPSWFF